MNKSRHPSPSMSGPTANSSIWTPGRPFARQFPLPPGGAGRGVEHGDAAPVLGLFVEVEVNGAGLCVVRRRSPHRPAWDGDADPAAEIGHHWPRWGRFRHVPFTLLPQRRPGRPDGSPPAFATVGPVEG